MDNECDHRYFLRTMARVYIRRMFYGLSCIPMVSETLKGGEDGLIFEQTCN